MLLNIHATSKHVSHELNGSICIQQGVTYNETGMLIITAEITPNVATYYQLLPKLCSSNGWVRGWELHAIELRVLCLLLALL
jgi:hypothetical protein